MEKKYKLSDASLEELEAFKQAMDKILSDLSLAISLSINKKEISIKKEDGTIEKVFADYPSFLIQKKIEVEEPKVLKDELISPIQYDDIAKEN